MEQSHLPEGVFLVRKQLEVLVGQLHRGQRLQAQVGPAPHEVGQVDKGVRPQAVVPVVGQVGHEDADLEKRDAAQCTHELTFTLAGRVIAAALVLSRLCTDFSS